MRENSFEDCFKEAEDRLVKFSLLPEGWFYGKGKSLSNQLLIFCREILSYLKSANYDSVNFALGGDGEISFVAQLESVELEAVIYQDGGSICYVEKEDQTLEHVGRSSELIGFLKEVTFFVNLLKL